jgi:tetratricopeptide (TPR) repeat protein
VLSELGVPGGVLLLLFLAGAGLAVARARTAPQRAIVVAGTGMLVVWLVHTSVDWLHLLPGVTIIALIGLALLSAAGPGAGRTSGSSGRRLALIGVLTAAALLAAAVGRLYAAELYRERAASNVAHAPREALRQSSQAIAIDGDLLEAYYVRAAALARLDDYAGARSALLSAVAREPHNYVPFALLGDLATRAGDSEAAQRYYRRADALNPYDAAHGNGLAESSR